ncbi:MAG: T9SS type A sorting domain-containing protein [Bacteroidota bacterium]
MRKFILFFFLISCSALSAQLTPINSCGISFDYDNAGNRVKRYICLENRPMRYTDATADEQATQRLDLQATMAEEDIEKEILQLEALLSQPGALDLQSSDQPKEQPIALTNQNFSDLSAMLVFPNPTMNSFSISGDRIDPTSTLSIVSMSGQVVLQRLIGDGRDIDVSSLPVGAYMVTLVDKEERRVSMLIKSDQP